MLRSFLYEFKKLMRQKNWMFWIIVFPIFMGTMFNIVIHAIGDDVGAFQAIPVALVEEGEQGDRGTAFIEMLYHLSEEKEPVLDIEVLSMDEAKEQLNAEYINGIYFLDGDDLRLIVANEGIQQSVLRMISNRFYQAQSTIETIAQNNPQMIPQAVEDLGRELNINQGIEAGRGTMNFLIYVKLVFLAMSVFQGAHIGLSRIHQLQGNRSPLGARRSVTPTNKIKQIIPQFLASSTFLFLYTCVALFYYIFVLDVQFGSQLPLVLLAIFVGSLASISIGMFIGTIIYKGIAAISEMILSGLVMLMIFLSGVMVIDIRILTRENFLILDRINPLTLLTDAFYSLGSFSDYRIYNTSLIGMLAVAVVCCVVSAIILRRQTYDSI
ncbi:MAG: ABC transporter permease [Lachnospiraceae bacterium]|nr:ABC transporter permease [Lachnospiraceae bacterium]